LNPPRLPTHPAFHAFLFLTTLLTTTLLGGFTLFSNRSLAQALKDPAVWTTGLKFSLPLLLILGVHELGHTVACRHYGLPATLPYFVPAPIGIGTFGAVIRIRAPISDKRVLFDVGAAGPLAGFAVSLPILVWGIIRSTPTHLKPTGPYVEFGEPLLFKGLEHWLVPATRSGSDLLLSPPGFAAWFGLLVTALNLLPLAQLDGGHILYSVFGKRQKPVALVLFAALVGMSVLWPGWAVWAIIVLVMGIAHPPTAEASPPLDAKRRWLAALCLAVFVVSFTPVPVRFVSAPAREKPARTYNL
jgi:membrane-associated protease RseP (regulator of RpoE activity)